MNGNNRNDVKIGFSVLVVEKQNQRSGTTTEGVVKKDSHKLSKPSSWYQSYARRRRCR